MNKSSTPYLSVVIPVHNEEGNLQWHHNKIAQFFAERSISYEIIYVDDGSTDTSLEILRELAEEDKNVQYVSFSRNFGKEAATTAGLKKVRGKAAIVIDGDGQHPIELVDTFLQKWKEGHDVVIGVRESNQGEGLIKKYGSKLFYGLLRFLDSGQDIQSASTDFRLIDKRVVDEFNKLTERNRVARNLIDWLGFKRCFVPFNALARHSGQAAYSFGRLFKLAIDGMIKHSTRPLQLIGAIGVLISLLSIITGLFLIIETYLLGDPMRLAVTGTAILALFLSFLVGVVLVCQGLLALYLENVYHETQNRPLYIVREETQ